MASILNSMTSFGGRIEVVELVDLAAHVDSVIELCLRSYDDADRLQVIREFEPLERIAIDRHKLMEILVNLVLNAVQSLDAARVEAPMLTVRILASGDETVTIEVEDNGQGIEPIKLNQIFALGYSTRPHARGLGLHLSGTAAVELGGQLTGHSDGMGQGAKFTLTIPRSETGQPAASVQAQPQHAA